MRYGEKKIPPFFFLAALLYLGYCFLFTPNFYLSIPVIVFPLLAFRLFWMDNQPNVLFWGLMLQWISAATQLLYANFLGISLEEKMKDYSFPAHMMESATLLSTVGLFAFSMGLYVAVKKITFSRIEFSLDKYSPKKILILYLFVSVIIYLTSSLIWAFPGIVQYVYSLFYLKWGFFLLAFYIIHKRAPFLRWWLYGMMMLEIFLGLNSFFAREILFVILFSILAIAQLQPRLTLKSYFFLSLGLALIVHYLILWSAIKTEYRDFVSKGQTTQAVMVSPAEARDKFLSLVTSVDDSRYQHGVEEFVNRLGYIQFFAACLDHVPKTVPHQNGKVYSNALQHYLVPRFLNPDKEILDDSKHTSKFTGIRLSGAKQASSFSLGYIADAYVDFGYILMFPLLFAFGWLFGFFYRFLIKRCPNQLWVWILTSPFLILLNINGTDTKKALGSLLIYFLTVAILRKQIIKVIDPLMRVRIKNAV